MNPVSSQQELAHTIAAAGGSVVDRTQVARRMKRLLPEFLAQIERAYRTKHSYSKAKRLALLDASYRDLIERSVTLDESARSARVSWETSRMLYEVRRSLR